MTTLTAKPASQAQVNRVKALMERNIVHIAAIPETSWECSAIIRTAAASKRDKEEVKSKGGRTLARMTSGEVEMTEQVLAALKLIDEAGVKNAKVLEGASMLRKHFCSKAQ